MNINKLFLSVLIGLMAVGTASAQEMRGTVCDENKEPLVGASVYWAGTRVGTSADVEGRYHLHRVKGFNRLVASYLGYINDTILVKEGVDLTDFVLKSEGENIETVVINSNQSGNYVKRMGTVKTEMISYAGFC